MSDYVTRFRDYCNVFAKELGVPFEFDDRTAFQYVEVPTGTVLLSPYVAFDCDPVADAKKMMAKEAIHV